MDHGQIKQQLIDFVCRNFMVEQEEIILDRSLVEQGIIDSFGLIELSTFMKNNFKISIAQQEMNKENFGSIERQISFIEGKICHDKQCISM